MLMRILALLTVFGLFPLACVADSLAIRAVHTNPWPQDGPPRVAEVLRHIERTGLGYKVAIDFDQLPQPLRPVHATVTVICEMDDNEIPASHSVILKFGVDRDQIAWVGERIVSFGDQWKNGDIRTARIEFTLLQSRGRLIVNRDGLDWDLPVGWCFDQNGTLLHLGFSPAICDALPTVFFEGDSLKILTGGPRDPNGALVDAYYTVVPPFRIGDTSTVCFHITALHNLPDGFDMEIAYGHMSVSNLPEAVTEPLSVGQTLDLCVQVVPLRVRELHELTLKLESGSAGPRRSNNEDFLTISALFRDDGSLRCVNHGSMLPIDEAKLTRNLPAGTRETCGSIRIDRHPKSNEGIPPGDDQ